MILLYIGYNGVPPPQKKLLRHGHGGKAAGDWVAVKELTFSSHMSYSLNSLKGGYIGDDISDYYRGS